MELNLTETRSRVTKTVTASSGNYTLTATAVIENNKIISINGTVTDVAATGMAVEYINFEGRRNGDELKVDYRNIAADERDTLDIISAMVDAVVAKYEVSE